MPPTCGILSNITNGTIIYDSIQGQLTAIHFCLYDELLLHGNLERICNTSTRNWTGQEPECRTSFNEIRLS